jgi:hypothetical protein
MSKFMPFFRVFSVVFIYLFSYFYFVDASDITLGSIGNKFSIPINPGFAINITFSNNGNFMYIGNFASTIYQFSLPTAYDVTSAVYMNRSKSLSAQGSGMDEIRINNDGDKLFVLQFYNNSVYQYTLTTPHNILSATYDGVSKSLLGSNNYTIDIKPDGTKLYSMTDYNNRIYEYNFSTPWNLATLSSNPVASLPTPNFANGQKLSMGFIPNGESLYIQTDTSERIHWLSLSTPWLISSATYTAGKYVSVSSSDSSMRAIATNNTGSKLYFMGSASKSIYEFNLNDTVAPTISSINSSSVNGSYTIGDSINITITFSESVTSSGPISLTFETGETDRTCTINITSSTTGTCTYTVQSGDTSNDLDATVTGTIYDASNNLLSNFTPSSSLASLKNIVIDTATPNISSLNISSILNTSVLVNWVTNEISSSLIKFGPFSNVTNQTDELNTVARVTNHSVPLSGLLPCTIYYYQALSRDEASNSIESSLGEFTTTGCLVSNIASGNVERLSISGGSLSIPNSDSVAKLIVPNNYFTSPASFQISILDDNSFTNPPTDLSLAGGNLYKLNAITDNNTSLPSFDSNITFEIEYPNSITNTLDEDTFDIYKYNGTSWDKKNCILNKTQNKITCSLSNFSVYGLFGEGLAPEPDPDPNSNGNVFGKNVFHKDRRCHSIIPSSLTWATFESDSLEKGLTINWSLENATHVDILIDNGTGNYPYKISKTINDGSEFLSNVESWQKIRILPYNTCKSGNLSPELSPQTFPKGWFNDR